MSTDTARQAYEFRTALIDTNKEVQAIEREIGNVFLPLVLGGLKDVNRFLKENRGEVKTWAKNVVDDLRDVIYYWRIFKQLQGHVMEGKPYETDEEAMKRSGMPTMDNPYGDRPELDEKIDDVTTKRTGGEDFSIPKTGGKKGGADKAARERIRQLEEETKGIEDEYKNQSDKLKRQYDLQLINLKNFTDAEIIAEQNRFIGKRDILLQERDLEKDKSGRDKIDRELYEAQQAQDKNIQKLKDDRDKKELDATREHRDALLRMISNQEQAITNTIRAAVEQRRLTEDEAKRMTDNVLKASLKGDITPEDADVRLKSIKALTSFEEAERAIAELQRDGAEQRKAILIASREDLIAKVGGIEKDANQEELQRIKDQLAAIEKLETANGFERERRIRAGHDKDLELARQFRASLLQLERDTNQARVDNERAGLEQLRTEAERHGGLSLKMQRYLISERHRLDLEEETARHTRALNEIEDEKSALLRVATTEEQKLEIERNTNAQREQEAERHRLATQGINSQADSDTQGTTLKGQLKKIFVDDIPTKSPADVALGTTITLFKNLKSAVLEATNAYIMYGASIGQFFKQALAATASYLAQEAELQAMKQGALALGALAIGDFRGFALHTAAAAGWLALAGGAIYAGRKFAGNSNQAASVGAAPASSYASGGSNANSDPRVITENRNQWQQPAIPSHPEATVHVIVHSSTDTGAIQNVIGAYIEHPSGRTQVVNALTHEYHNNERLTGMLQHAVER